jgi:hypothetical protein
MADLPAHPETGDGPGLGPGSESIAAKPRWKTTAWIVLGVVVVVVFIALHLTGVIDPGGH